MRILDLFVLMTVACGASGATAEGPKKDAALPPIDGFDASAPEASFSPSDLVDIIIVNDLRTMGDVRVCLGTAGYPLPEDAASPMPLANYPGIALGRGVAVGHSHAKAIDAGALTITIYDAKALLANVSTETNPQIHRTCGDIIGIAPLGTVSANVTGGVPVIVLHDSKGVTATTFQAAGSYMGETNELRAQLIVANAPWATTTGKFGTKTSPTMFPTGTTAAWKVDGDFSNQGVVLAGTATETFWQSLVDIQTVSDPTHGPSAFFERRTNYVFVAVGDETKLYDGNQGIAFDGKALHIIAVAYDTNL